MCFYFLRMRTIFTFEVTGARLARLGGVPSPWHGPMLFSYFYSMQPCSFLHKVSSRVSCSMGLAMAVARVLIRCRLISRSNSRKGSLDSSVPLFFSCSRPLSRSSERDARIERLLTNRPSSASTPSLESFSVLLLLVYFAR